MSENQSNLLKGYEEISKVSASDNDENYLKSEMCSLSFFATERAIIIDSLEKIDVQKGESIVSILERVPQNNRVIFKARTLEGNRKWVKTLKTIANVIDCQPKKPYEIRQIIDKELSKLQIGKVEKRFLEEALPQDLASIYLEIEKLTLYPDKLDLDTLKLLVEPALEDQVFSLVDCLVNKDWQGSLITVKELIAAGNEPFAILGAIIWQLRTLYKVIGYTGAMNDATKELGLRDFAIKKAKEVLRRLTKTEIEEWFLLALEADMNVKRGVLRPDLAIEMMVNKICLGIKSTNVFQ